MPRGCSRSPRSLAWPGRRRDPPGTAPSHGLLDTEELLVESLLWLVVGIAAQRRLTATLGSPVAPRFTREELMRFRDGEVPDLVGGQPPRLVFVGINPGLWTVATQTHFAHPSNRFYPAIHRAGLTALELDRVAGLTDADRRALIDRGVAITNVVRRATARASELSAAELRAGAGELERRIAAWRPSVVAVAGVTAYRTAFGRPHAVMGPQPELLGGAACWVVPNPSGLNAHETVDSLADWYRQVAIIAGIV